MIGRALAAGAGLLLVLAAAVPARAQGVVLGTSGAQLPFERVRALLVFQELGLVSDQRARASDNVEDLLVEIRLAAPAPAGAVWVLAAPRGASVRPGIPAVLDETSAHWRAWRPAAGAASAPIMDSPWPPSSAEGIPGKFAGPMELPALESMLRDRGEALPAGTRAVAVAEAAEGWRFFLAEVPSGSERLSAHLRFNAEVAMYPGALGAVAAAEAGGEAGRGGGGAGQCGLPPLELMVLHSHFLNVDDNVVGLAGRLGLAKVYQDPGTLQDGGHLWADPAWSRPGPVLESAGKLKASAGFMAEAAPKGLFFMTVVAGAPRCAAPARLDFRIFSHYPSGVDPLPSGRSALWLAALSAVLVVLAVWLLKRKGFAE
ncbi:MAG TPA: hypothetical protein PK280_12570 [Planctomycetota bacterium]|nr:hypothetical protein [Planctomycetota bacterium]